MSAAGRNKAPRKELDFYPTPPWVTRLILDHVMPDPVPAQGRTLSVLEPAAGEGHILEVVRERAPWAELNGIELDPLRAATCRERLNIGESIVDGSFLDASTRFRSAWQPDLVITNPPFDLAIEFVKMALSVFLPKTTIAMLMRLAFLETEARADLMATNCPDVYVLATRPSFVKGAGKTQSDSAAYAWFVWPSGERGRSSGRVRVLRGKGPRAASDEQQPLTGLLP